jgi:hypothetical protein
MKRINELNINISKAVITDIKLRLSKEGLEVEVYGDLITKTGKSISHFSFSTTHWEEDQKLQVPMDIHNPARKIFEILTPVIYSKIEGEFKALPKGQGVKIAEEDINPEDIPF